MEILDWAVLFAFLAWVVWSGVRQSRRDADATEIFLAGRSAPWWMMGLSIMATQASAITLVGTTGLGYEDGLRFLQFYYGLPIAMVVIGVWLLPLYRRHRVFTAYEFLGARFDERTRLLSAATFLALRGLSVGIVIAAPSVVLAAVLGVPIAAAVLVMGGVAIVYTAIGGMRADLATDVKQMAVMILGMAVVFVSVILALPDEVGIGGALRLADATERLVLADPRFDPGEQYTLWSSLLGGTLLFLAYFGCDQSQAQRYFAGRSLAAERGALALNACAKVPFQLLILSTGTLLFAFHLFEAPPPSFVPAQAAAAASAPAEVAAERAAWEETRSAALRLIAAPEGDPLAREEFRAAAERGEEARARLQSRLREASGDGSRETNYVFLHFIRERLPAGLVGLLIAAIIAAALSSIDSELNAMATVAVMDLHPRGRRRELTAREERRLARSATALIGLFATAFALWGTGFGSLIEAVNSIGSWFYGALLGVFVLAVAARRVEGTGAFAAILAGILAVVAAHWIALARGGELPFLWRNTIGTVAAVVTGIAVSSIVRLRAGGKGGRTAPRAPAGAPPAEETGPAP